MSLFKSYQRYLEKKTKKNGDIEFSCSRASIPNPWPSAAISGLFLLYQTIINNVLSSTWTVSN